VAEAEARSLQVAKALHGMKFQGATGEVIAVPVNRALGIGAAS
jgi:hypothetical protein